MAGKRVFSAIQPSGDIHIGNYIGAIRNWVAMQEQYQCIFGIADYHAMTIAYDPDDMRKRIFNACADLLACGIDPEKSVLFVQSMVPEHTELSWLLACSTSLGDLERMTQFKDKAEQHRKNVNAGLFTYPVLQTADISLYKAEAVPVGEDQIQHLELAREILRRFNGKFGEIFPEPQAIVTKGARIKGLDGENKMSKSMNNYIGIMEEPEAVWKKLASAKTDENRKRLADPGDPEVCNIYSLHKAFTDDRETLDWVENGCRNAEFGCVVCKKKLAENMEREFAPIREKRKYYDAHPEVVEQAVVRGTAVCRSIAQQTMNEVHRAIGSGADRFGTGD